MTVVTISSKADTAADAVPAGDGSKHAQALAALRSAEARTGVRRQATAARPVQTVRAEQPVEARRVQVRALRGGLLTDPLPASTSVENHRSAASTTPSSGGRVGHPGEDTRVLPVHPHLAAFLPDGGLRAGTTVAVRGSTSLLLTLLAEASRDGAWTVLVGYPAAGLAAAADAGCDLARTLVVPLPAGSGVDAPAVLAALIDGMDVVVVGPEVALLDQDRRRLTARARDRGTVLLPSAPSGAAGGWTGAHVVLEATAGSWAGADGGVGWLRRRTLRVRRTGRGSAARPVHLDVEVPVCRAAVAEPLGARGPGVVQDEAVQDTGAESRPSLELVG